MCAETPVSGYQLQATKNELYRCSVTKLITPQALNRSYAKEYQKRIETHCWCSGAAVHDADFLAAEFVKNCLVVVPLGYYEGERRAKFSQEELEALSARLDRFPFVSVQQ
ncbi:UNVERIFIED_CONTAM: hypothetical protein Slati_4525000 [Sesamum latifolium]|uniref:Uncharacterized protein n=1 Tax=Sesamum latifolium TaxID=2727402 RepID=A0AAW2SIQ2_9LAMI